MRTNTNTRPVNIPRMAAPLFLTIVLAACGGGGGGSGSSESAAAAPTFSPAAGSYGTAQSVTLTDATTGAAIYYTTDGSTPTASSTKYTAPISVSASETIKAIAAASGDTNSSVGSAA